MQWQLLIRLCAPQSAHFRRSTISTICVLTQPGEAVILNAANSTVGQVVIQLCKILKLRSIAIVRKPDAVAGWLKELGASVVISDTATIKVRQ